MQFSVGNVFGTGLRMWLHGLWRHALLIVVGYAPVLGLVGYVLALDPTASREALRLYGDSAGVALLLFELPITAVISHAVVAELRGQRPSRRASLIAGLRRTPQVVLVMALIDLVLLAIGFVAALPIAGADTDTDTVGGAVTVALLMMALWAACALALLSRWAIALPAAVMERPGIVGALRRSDQLTAGRRARTAVLVVLVGAIHVGVLAVVVSVIDSRYDPPSTTADVCGWAALVVLWMPLSVLRAAFAATAFAFIVEDVEGDSPQRLDDVFD